MGWVMLTRLDLRVGVLLFDTLEVFFFSRLSVEPYDSITDSALDSYGS